MWYDRFFDAEDKQYICIAVTLTKLLKLRHDCGGIILSHGRNVVNMANTGDSYVIELKESHLAWGTYRNTLSRTPRRGEAYLPIPIRYARRYGIYNSNGTHGADIVGENIFHCVSADGFLDADLKAQGCSDEGVIYAKQFSVHNDLTALGNWYRQVGARPGDEVRVVWLSPTEIEIELIHN